MRNDPMGYTIERKTGRILKNRPKPKFMSLSFCDYSST
jgi:hypothetical protein